MQPIGEAVGGELRWTSVSAWRHRFTLHAKGELVARLQWEKAFGSLAVAETANGKWTFKRCGFLSPTVTIRAAGTEAEIATLRVGWRGDGILSAPSGRRYQWSKVSFWRSAWAFGELDGDAAVHFEPELMKRSAKVKLDVTALALPDLPLLVCLGWYLMVLMADEGAVAAAAAAG